MPIAFARLTIQSRSKGHSAVAAAAYRAGLALYDERTGETHDFSQRSDIAYAEILLPEKSHAKFMDREFLWNRAELAERRKDAQVAKELTIAIPKELELEDQIALLKQFAFDNFVCHGLVADVAIHNRQDGNPHAHILVSMRRLEHDRFALKKARDLNPVFYGRSRKTVYDFWNQKWREAQNAYFKAHNLDLTVDADYLIATRHQGRIRNPEKPHYLRDENTLAKQASFEQSVAAPDAILAHLSERYATFTDRDIASVVFKNTETQEDFQHVMAQVKASQSLILLGYAESGRAAYTTRDTYKLEQQLIVDAISLSGRKDKSISSRLVRKVSERYGLKNEQAIAVKHLIQSGDVGCLLGRAGTGKTYTMQAVRDLYESKDYAVYGATLSGVAAKVLEAETGIKSDTIHSLSHRIEKGAFQPKENSVIVIDEAGMVALKDMARIIRFAKKSRCKVLLLGDTEQLQAIEAGAPFKAIMDHVGFVEMRDIQRQKDAMDRQASVHLATGEIGLAIKHYQQKHAVHLLEQEAAMSGLLSSWTAGVVGNTTALEHSVILAHTRKQVAMLNERARESLIANKMLFCDTHQNTHLVQSIDGQIALAPGDRILFLKNDYTLQVNNGDFATVESISHLDTGSRISVQIGRGEDKRRLEFHTSQYHDFTYGYAATVHKTQGTTFDNVYAYIDSHGWDRHLAYVAMTRHKEVLKVFANKDRYRTSEALTRQLSRSPTRDNAIDYPLSFSERRGFDPDSALGRALNRMAGIGHKIKDGWLFVSNYETWVICRQRNERIQSEQVLRYEARKIAQFADFNQTVKQDWARYYDVQKNVQKNAQKNVQAGQFKGKSKNVSSFRPEKHPEKAFEKTMDLRALTNATTKRNQMAYDVYVQFAKYRKAIEANHLKLSDLERYADLHIKRQRVLAFMQSPTELLKGRLAHDIAQDRKAYHPFVQEIGLDWKTINYANWQYNHRKTLQKTGEWNAHQTVLRYVQLRRDAAKAWSRANAEYKAPGENPNRARNFLRAEAVTRQLDKTSHLIQSDFDKHKQALEFFKVDQTALKKCVNRYYYRQTQAEQRRTFATPPGRYLGESVYSEHWDAQAIHQSLAADPEKTYRSIFGEPKKKTSKEMRYPGGLIVTTKGTHAGEWYSFTSDQGGGPIQAIQYQMGLSYVEALEYGARLAGIRKSGRKQDIQYDTVTESIRQKAKAARIARFEKERAEKEARIAKARKIFGYAKPLSGPFGFSDSVAEQYLKEHRGISEGLDRMQFRSLDGYSDKKDIPPSLVLPAYNADNELVAIQRVFLDKQTANKASQERGKTAKISTGAIKGAAGIVQIGQEGGRVYLAEGPETGATLAMADPDATVLVAFSVSNLGNLAEVIKHYNAYEVILAKDNDGRHAKSDRAFNKSLKVLEDAGLSLHVFEPQLTKDMKEGIKKVDWNDILKEQGIDAVRIGLGLQELKEEWTALRKLQHKGINVLDKCDKKLSVTTDAQERKRLSKVRDEIVSKLLIDKDLPKLEQIAPRAIGELRSQFYHKYLSREQKAILLHPDWDTLFSGQAQNSLLRNRIELLQRIRKNSVDYLHDPGKMRHFTEAMDSVLRKINKDASQSTELKKLAPSLHATIKGNLAFVECQYGLKQYWQRETGLSRERER